MWQRCVGLMALAVFILAQAQSDSSMNRYMEKRSKDRYCGKSLANVLQLVCNGQYNGMAAAKKADKGNLI